MKEYRQRSGENRAEVVLDDSMSSKLGREGLRSNEFEELEVVAMGELVIEGAQLRPVKAFEKSFEDPKKTIEALDRIIARLRERENS